nr:MAG TPA: HemY protein N-terminus [Caudoviricetes sp.]
MDVIKYAVECDSLYNVVAFFMICTLLGFVTWLLYKVVLALFGLIRYIINKVTKYKDVHAKAQCKNASLEVDLHERDRMGTE